MSEQRAHTDRWLVVGLGNPGIRYQRTRHNIGFTIVDRFVEEQANAVKGSNVAWREMSKFRADVVTMTVANREIYVVKPQTYMNLSGQSVCPLARYYKIAMHQVLVIHDDLDLDLGRLKLKQGGGDGGHNGLKSIGQECGSRDFMRIRVGIGRPKHGDTTGFVLSSFDFDEHDLVERMVLRAKDAVKTVLEQGILVGMNRFNRNE